MKRIDLREACALLTLLACVAVTVLLLAACGESKRDALLAGHDVPCHWSGPQPSTFSNPTHDAVTFVDLPDDRSNCPKSLEHDDVALRADGTATVHRYRMEGGKCVVRSCESTVENYAADCACGLEEAAGPADPTKRPIKVLNSVLSDAALRAAMTEAGAYVDDAMVDASKVCAATHGGMLDPGCFRAAIQDAYGRLDARCLTMAKFECRGYAWRGLPVQLRAKDGTPLALFEGRQAEAFAAEAFAESKRQDCEERFAGGCAFGARHALRGKDYEAEQAGSWNAAHPGDPYPDLLGTSVVLPGEGRTVDVRVRPAAPGEVDR